jgi:hypothetical protein
MKRLTLLLFFLLTWQVTTAQSYQLHSVFMYSFARYIQWPEGNTAGDFQIVVLGDSPILSELQNLAAKKKIGERTIHVARIASAADLTKCNILFISADQSAHLQDVLNKLGDDATLVVTEQAGLGTKGSNINFVQKDGKLAFELNTASFNRRKLKPSTELTRIAILI